MKRIGKFPTRTEHPEKYLISSSARNVLTQLLLKFCAVTRLSTVLGDRYGEKINKFLWENAKNCKNYFDKKENDTFPTRVSSLDSYKRRIKYYSTEKDTKIHCQMSNIILAITQW